MNKQIKRLACLCCVSVSLTLSGCKSWDFSITPAKLLGPTYEQERKLEELAPSNIGTCPTPQQMEEQEKEFYKLQLIEDQERFWI